MGAFVVVEGECRYMPISESARGRRRGEIRVGSNARTYGTFVSQSSFYPRSNFDDVSAHLYLWLVVVRLDSTS